MPTPPPQADPTDPHVHPAVEEVNEAVRLATEGQLDEAVAKLSAVIERFEGDPDRLARLGAAGALFNKGLALHELGRIADALEALETTTDRYGGDEDPLVRLEAARALRNRVALLATTGRTQEALGASRELVTLFGDDAEVAVKQVVRDGLNDFAIALAAQGREDDAVATFGQIVQVYAGAEDLDSMHDTAMARYHRAVVLRDAGRREEALAEFDLGLDSVGHELDATLEPMRARLHYNKAVVLHELDRFGEAIEHYSVVEREFFGSEVPDVRSWVARSIYNHGSAQASQAKFDEALATWDQLSQRGDTGGDTTTRERAAAVTEQRRWLQDMRARPHHIRSNPFEQSLTDLYTAYVETGIDPESGEPVPPEVAREYAEGHREGLDRKDALAGERHDAAAAVLWDYRDRDRPFVLFLRNFDLEAYVATGRRMLLLGGQRPTTVEERLTDCRPSWLPVVGIANPLHRLETHFFDGEIMPRLEISHDRWLDRVEDLVEHAAVILIAAQDISPGLSAELSAVSRAGREDSTVIVLTSREDALETDLAQLYGARLARRRPAHVDSRAFARFPRVIDEEQVPWAAISAAEDASEILDAVSAAAPSRQRTRPAFWPRRS